MTHSTVHPHISVLCPLYPTVCRASGGAEGHARPNAAIKQQAGAMQEIAEVLLKEGKAERALVYYKRAQQYSPRNVDVRRSIALLQAKLRPHPTVPPLMVTNPQWLACASIRTQTTDCADESNSGR